MMKSVIPILVQGTILALAPHNTNGEILLGKVGVSVVSNQTLQRVDEYNYTRPVLRDISPQALPSGQTENDLINQQLVMQMDVCFPKHYCPIVSTKEGQFKSTFNSHVCRQYCANPQYKSEVEVIDICDLSTYSNYGCVNFGLTTHASSISEAENIKMELGENMITSKPAWKELLNELAPYFDPDVTTPEIVGYHIGQDTGEVWHPAWDSGTELCSKDSNVPFYMKLDPDEYLAPTMTDCCRKHYWWNVRGCAEPQNRPCPEGWVQTAEQTAREGIMSGKYYGSYPNIFYSGCKPVSSPHYNNRKLEVHGKEDKEELARRRVLSHREQEDKLRGLLERQKRLEKLMQPSSHRPPVEVPWKPQRLR